MVVPEHLQLAALQAGVISRKQLAEVGVGPHAVARRVASGRLVVVARGVLRVSGSPPSWYQELWTALLAAQLESVVSHRSAARLHVVGRFGFHVDVVQIGNPITQVSTGSGHRSLHVPPHHRTVVQGIPTTTLARTIFDLAGQVSVKRWRRGLPNLNRHQVERALDDALSGGLAFGEIEALTNEIGGRGRGGTVLMRELLSYRGPGFVATESELEDLLVDVLARHGLPAPARQRNLGGTDRIGRVDFAFLEERVVIEVDGRKTHTALLDREGDHWRDLELAAAGFQVIRVTWTQLTKEPQRFVANLRLVLAGRAAA